MKHIIKNIAKKFPFLNDLIFNYELSKKFNVEIALLKNKHETNSKIPSVLHFSINKAATQHVKNVLLTLSKENELTPVSIHDYAFFSNIPFLDHLSFKEMEKYKHIFKEKGYIYSVFGGAIENIDNFHLYNVVLSIRDPRDILVSNYYSSAYSHSIPPSSSNKRNMFLERRESALNADIDEFVLNEAEQIFSTFNNYKTLVCKNENIGIVKYEKMISDYKGWLLELSEKSGLEISDSLLHILITEFNNKKPKKENIQTHNRKGVAGDYKEKLKAETIDKLNHILAPVLTFFNYTI